MRLDTDVVVGTVASFKQLTKSFGPTKAVDSVSFDLEGGEVHALVGENGAGKSTVIRILAGDHKADSGAIELNGKVVSFDHPEAALQHRVGFVHQIPTSIPGLSVTENLGLGAPLRRNRIGLIDWNAEHRAAEADLLNVGLMVDPRRPLSSLGPAERQLVAMARALRSGLDILVLDEITASLSEPEVRVVHDQINRLVERGIAVLYVSHRLEEIFRIADRVTVMRDGKWVATLPVTGLTQNDLVRCIVGADVKNLFSKPVSEARLLTTAPRLELRGVWDSKLRDLNLNVRAGEIVGIAGLGGSGRSRILRIIYGAQGYGGGEISLDGSAYRLRSAADAISAGVGLVTEDRITDGFVATLPIWQNITLPWPSRFSRRGLLQLQEERSAASLSASRLGVKMPSVSALMTQLSGGNQQKAILARWTIASVRLLLLDEPTHGVDIRSKAQIYDLVRKQAKEGLGILLVSSELDELVALCDRVYILRENTIDVELTGDDVNKDRILHSLLVDRQENRDYGQHAG